MSSPRATTHTTTPLHFSDCRTALPACSCYTIPFPLLMSSLAHSSPSSISTIPLGQRFASQKLGKFHLPSKAVSLPLYHIPSPYFLHFLYWDGRTQLYQQESESFRRWTHTGEGSKIGGKVCFPFSSLFIHPSCCFSFSPLVNTCNFLGKALQKEEEKAREE